MDVVVVFRFKDIDDAESADADFALAELEEDIAYADISCDEWWIADAYSGGENYD